MTVINTLQIDCGGHSIHALQAGPDSGPLIILPHGKMFQAATWRETGTLAEIAAAGYQALALDLPEKAAALNKNLVDPRPVLESKGILN